MRTMIVRRATLIVAITSITMLLINSGHLSATDVLQGFTTITALPGTQIDIDGGGSIPPIDMGGLPLGSFDFGGSIGVQATGDADTILQRTNDAIGGGTQAVAVEFTALQLVSVNPIDLSLVGSSGTDFLFVHLDPVLTSNGTITVDLDNLTFDGNLSVTIELRDSLDNVLQDAILDTMTWTGAPWSSTPAPLDLNIPGVQNGFFPGSGDEIRVDVPRVALFENGLVAFLQ